MVIPFLSALVIFFTFRFWITLLPLSSGDWPYLFLENIKEFSWFPEIRYLWLAPYYQIVTKFVVEYLQIPLGITEKLFWFLPFIIISLLGSYKFTKSVLGALIYTTNTYALMIVGGGQLGIALSYALAPLVLKHLIEARKIVIAGFVLSLQMMFDPRIAMLTLVASIIYHFCSATFFKKIIFLGITVSFSIIINLYWIIPIFQSKTVIAQQIGEATIGSVSFLSFANFEQTISLLHPNWPENIFGKISFMKPEFLVLPMLAFGSLLILNNPKSKSQKTAILFFAFLGLLGAFLAKGTNPPFGELYSWLFTSVPGFALFRDPTKFYLYVALSYSVLIPFVFERLRQRISRLPYHVSCIIFLLFWSFTIRAALFGQLSGTFRPMPIPQEYILLKDFIGEKSESFHTLWIPERQRFGFASKLHPSVDARLLSGQSSISGILAWITREQMPDILITNKIQYMIVPYDSRGELFLTDRKYDETVYVHTLNFVSHIPWLRKLDGFGKIGVFEVIAP